MKSTDYFTLIGSLLAGFTAVMAAIWIFLLLAPGEALSAKDAWVAVALLYPTGSVLWLVTLLVYRYCLRKPWPLLAVFVYAFLCFAVISQIEGWAEGCFFEQYAGTTFLGNEIFNDMGQVCGKE